MDLRFKVILELNEEDGGYTVTVPALPGCITEGNTLEDAIKNVREAIIGYLEVLKMKGEHFPIKEPPIFIGEVEVSV